MSQNETPSSDTICCCTNYLRAEGNNAQSLGRQVGITTAPPLNGGWQANRPIRCSDIIAQLTWRCIKDMAWRFSTRSGECRDRPATVAGGSAGSTRAHSQKLLTRERPLSGGAGGDNAASRSFDGRGDRIRTCDPLVPNQMRYQTAPLPDEPPRLERPRGGHKPKRHKHWWARQDSNPQPSRYERPALTIELQAPSAVPP